MDCWWNAATENQGISSSDYAVIFVDSWVPPSCWSSPSNRTGPYCLRPPFHRAHFSLRFLLQSTLNSISSGFWNNRRSYPPDSKEKDGDRKGGFPRKERWGRFWKCRELEDYVWRGKPYPTIEIVDKHAKLSNLPWNMSLLAISRWRTRKMGRILVYPGGLLQIAVES